MRLVAALLLLGVVLLAAVALGACADVERTSWRLSTFPDDADTTLQLGVAVGGCDKFDHFDMRENAVDINGQLVESVTIEAYIDHNARSSCDDVINHEEQTIELSAPLGDRPLRGCNPPSAIYGVPDYPPDDDCAS